MTVATDNPTQVDTQELTKLRHYARQISLPPKKKVSSLQMGAYLSSVRGRGMDFEETRQYQPGDDIRLMDWRVTARTGVAHTKVFRDERERPIIVLLDLNRSMFFGTRVTFKSCIAAKVATLIGWAAIQNGDRVGTIIYHPTELIELRPTGGQRGIFQSINVIRNAANKKPESNENDLSRALRHLRRVTKPGSMIFVISDFWNQSESVENELSNLSMHNDVFCTLISDPAELQSLPRGAYPVQLNNQPTWLDLSSSNKQTSVQQILDQRISNLTEFCMKRRINLLRVNTNDHVANALISQMGRRT